MKLFFLLTSLFLCLVLFNSCSNGSKNSLDHQLKNWVEGKGKIKVLSTTAMIDDLVKEIGSENVQTMTLITGQLDPHTYQLVKGDDEKLSVADVIFYNGLGLEHGPSLQRYLHQHNKAIGLGNMIRRDDPDAILMQDSQIDPHIWMDISLWMQAVDIIVTELSDRDPENSSKYFLNGLKVKQQMEAAHREAIDLMGSIPPEKRYLVTSHDAFNYFTRAYLATPEERMNGDWRKRFAAPEGLAPEGQLSAKDIQGIIDYLSEHKISVLFPESNVSKDSIKKIVNAGSKEGMVLVIAEEPLYADAMGPAGSDGDTYLKMMKHDVAVIVKYLK